jgi:pyridinium-3,5-bisthiocarboxylic acid mononucleotide nickel chelatase
MPDGRFAILDPASGISGDMLLGALLAAGAPAEWLRSLPARLGFPEVTVRTSSVDRCGVRAIKVDVCLPDGSTEGPSEEVHHHSHDHQAYHDHSHPHGPHRHIGELIGIVERAKLSAWV